MWNLNNFKRWKLKQTESISIPSILYYLQETENRQSVQKGLGKNLHLDCSASDYGNAII